MCADAEQLVAERRSFRFERSFRLPDLADANRIEAHLVDGVLTLTMPRLPAAGRRTIDVTVT